MECEKWDILSLFVMKWNVVNVVRVVSVGNDKFISKVFINYYTLERVMIIVSDAERL